MLSFDRRRIVGIGQMPGLTTLHHVDVFGGIEVTAARSGGVGGLLAVLAPDIRLSDIVIVGNGDHRAILQHVAKLNSKLQPAIGVLGVVIRLVAGKEQQIGIELDQVFDHLRPWPGRPGAVAGEVADHDDFFVDRILANQPVKLGSFCPWRTR